MNVRSARPCSDATPEAEQGMHEPRFRHDQQPWSKRAVPPPPMPSKRINGPRAESLIHHQSTTTTVFGAFSDK